MAAEGAAVAGGGAVGGLPARDLLGPSKCPDAASSRRRTSVLSRDAERRAFQWCREHLGGAWRLVRPEELRVNPVSGGLSNLLFRCSLPDHLPSVGEEPREVLLRLYGAILQGVDSLVLESVMFAILAERSLGPQLYGVFPEGRLEQYIPVGAQPSLDLPDAPPPPDPDTPAPRSSRPSPLPPRPPHHPDRFLGAEPDPENSRAAGASVFSSHCHEDGPVPRHGDAFHQRAPLAVWDHGTVLKADPGPAPQWPPTGEPAGDVQPKGRDGQSQEVARLHPITSGLLPQRHPGRGFDIGNHFCEWVYDYTHEEWPFYKAQPADYPTRDQQLHFIRHYLAEVKKGETPSQEEQRKLEEDLMVEISRYALASHFFWGLWSILQASMSTIEFGYLEYAQSRFQFYFQQKGQLTHLHPSS
ncbi:choline/ethanolamine kinase isoform X3 [Dasypus novemcinctus]|uniref:choline/ethanolamine kinase isoform X3 n=1 Tax=Dasypus novemcinctus TaxID=9361 RepID=UPI000328CD7A|nr:choline/ethanolamine kinase isoform X3 [Dasypus novemcinctus]